VLKAHEEKHDAQKSQAKPSHITLFVLRGKPYRNVLIGINADIDERGNGKGHCEGNDVAK
jgi:hypothetical protein